MATVLRVEDGRAEIGIAGAETVGEGSEFNDDVGKPTCLTC